MTNYSLPNITDPVGMLAYASEVSVGLFVPMVILTLSLIILVRQVRNGTPFDEALISSSVVALLLSLAFVGLGLVSGMPIMATTWLTIPIALLVLSVISTYLSR